MPKRRSFEAWWILAPALILGLLPVIGGTIFGDDIFVLRDIGTTHRPAMIAYESLGKTQTNPFASFGQPYSGNPNLLIAYPFPKGSRWVEFHVLLHLALCFAGTMLWLYLGGRTMNASFFGASVFTLSGYVLSAASSLNALTSIAWIPWVLSIVPLLVGRRRMQAAMAAIPLLALFSLAGEPVLIGTTLLIVIVALLVRRAWAGILLLLAAGAAAALLTLPMHRTTWEAALESRRVALGFSATEALAASLHPARLLEIIFPYLFGNPSRIGPGSYWGYLVNGGAQPYVFSIHVSIVGVLAAGAALTRPRREDRWVIAALFVGVIASMGGLLPGAHSLYERLGFLHVVRFPIKIVLFVTLLIALLAARGFDRVMEGRSVHRAIVPLGMAAAALCTLLAAWSSRRALRVRQVLESLWWDERWQSDPSVFLAPVVKGIPARFAAIALLIAIAAWAVAKASTPRIVVLQVAMLIELIVVGRWLLPTIPETSIRAPSALVQAARRLDGRIYERAGKDLHPALSGTSGTYGSDGIDQLALAQHRQAWALAGIRYGLPYAYDRAPDASYTWRNDLAADCVDRLNWPDRVAWLRAAGVRGIITSETLELPGVHALVYEESPGVPATLYAIAQSRGEVRRVSRVIWASTSEDALARMPEAIAETEDTIVVEAAARSLHGRGTARVTHWGPDSCTVQTDGDGPSILLIARSYTKQVRATVNGRATEVAPANLHLIAVFVPSGSAVVRVSFAPQRID